MKQATLCYIFRDDEILLGLKKRGFGNNKYNGFGGKVKPAENIKESAVRELKEEIDIDEVYKALEGETN